MPFLVVLMLKSLEYSETSINGHLYTTDTSEQRTNIFVPKYTMAKGDTSIQRTPLYNGRKNWSYRCPLYGGSTVDQFHN